jgi:hypothetical protein
MPLRDHFHPPFSNRRSWDWLHGGWPMTIASGLNRQLPERYVAGPKVHLGSIEIDVTAYDEGLSREHEGHGGVATVVWAPPRPTLAVVTEPDADVYLDQDRRAPVAGDLGISARGWSIFADSATLAG